MSILKYVVSALLLAGLFGGIWIASGNGAGVKSAADSGLPDLAYLKAVNSVAPPRDPQLLFLLMTQYASANRQGEGAEFFQARLKEFGAKLTDAQKSLYLSIIALLRAQHASSVPLIHRIGYVKETISILDKAKQLSGGNIFVVNWISGVVRSELPGMFGQGKGAAADLAWCEANARTAPHAGWLREVYYHLGKLALADVDQVKAQDYLRRSGYPDFHKPITLATPFSENATSGHAFAPRRIAEVVPGRVYVLTGFEFTEYYFVVSDDGRQLIGIDAGTWPDAAKGAYEALRAYAPNLPELTTIFVTHAHWDHVGGHPYFHSLPSHPRFYARSNYHQEVARQLNAPAIFGKEFFGDGFKMEDLRSFKPDVPIDRRTEMKIGRTQIELIPAEGGETHDAMLIYFPELKTMFVGDFIMPYLGAPFVEEGDLQGLLNAIDVVVEKNPDHILHGHEPLTQNFKSAAILAGLKTDLSWLREQVLVAVRRGDERGAIHNANLIPPGLLAGPPEVYQPYLILREHVIDRLYDQNIGYWQPDLQGMDHLTRADRAELLIDYLGLSESQIVKAVDRLAADGKYELAAALLESTGNRFEHSNTVANAKRLIYLKLMERNQNTDPFKFIIYSGRINEKTPQIAIGK